MKSLPAAPPSSTVHCPSSTVHRPPSTVHYPCPPPTKPPSPASDSAWAGALTFEYAYPELPESVITRFIVRAHEWIEAGQVWRWGAILAWDENRALVRASVAEKKVEIRVSGQENTRRDFLAQIRGHFAAIHKTFSESAGREAFPIGEFLCPPQYPGLWLDYVKLLTYERDGLTEIPETWQNRTIRLSVTEMLNGFVSPAARLADRERLFPEEERMPKEIHYHEHRHFEARDVTQAVVNLGDNNEIRQQFSHLSPEVQTTLAQLTAAVQAMLQHLSAEQAEETRDNLEHLQEELKKPKPSRKWYSVSIEGLIQAAKNVGAVGAPVLELAEKLLKIL